MESCGLCGSSWHYSQDGYAILPCCRNRSRMCIKCLYQIVHECVDCGDLVECRCGKIMDANYVKYLLDGDLERIKQYDEILNRIKNPRRCYDDSDNEL